MADGKLSRRSALGMGLAGVAGLAGSGLIAQSAAERLGNCKLNGLAIGSAKLTRQFPLEIHVCQTLFQSKSRVFSALIPSFY